MSFAATLKSALPGLSIISDPRQTAAFETDWRRAHSHPALCVALPRSTAEVAEIVKLCAAAGMAVVPQGGNTGLVAGGVPVAGRGQVIISLNRMNRILGLDVVGNSITMQAGATLAAVQQAAAAADRLFPVSLGSQGTAQIGGLVSTNAGGNQVLQYGSMRAQVLGLEVVLADGRIWNGLRALRKDNTGFDIKQLFIGAEGTLGIITAACLGLQPAVAHATALIGTATTASALDIFQTLRAGAGALLTMCEFMSRPAIALGAAHGGGGLPFEAPFYVLVELSGPAGLAIAPLLESLLASALASGAASDVVIAQSQRERDALLRLREAVPEGELAAGGAVKHDIAVPIAAIPATLHAIEALLAAHYPGCRLNLFGHLGDGNLHVNIRAPAGASLADLEPRQAAITASVEAIAVAQGGSFSAEHGIGQMRLAGMAAHKSPIELDLMRALKHALDPDDMFNPRKVLPP